MVVSLASNSIDLETFLKTAGHSFTDAQKSLVPGIDISTNMILNNADLELKVAVNSDSCGKMSISPISIEDISRGDIDPGLLSTLRISFISSISEAKPGTNTTSLSSTVANNIPSLKGILLEKAVNVLKSGGWRYEVHAATSTDLAKSDIKILGVVVKQTPESGQLIDKQKAVINIWVNLGNVPVSDIDGIGSRYRDRLRKINVSSVGELSLAVASQVSTVLRTSEARARSFIDLASLLTRLAVLGFEDVVVKLIVKSGQVRSLEQLSSADPARLYHACRAAISSGTVVVPEGFMLTTDDVAGWIKAAGYHPEE